MSPKKKSPKKSAVKATSQSVAQETATPTLAPWRERGTSVVDHERSPHSK